MLWCRHNVGGETETDYGEYFSWGNVTGHKSTNGSTFDDSYDWGNSNTGPYASTPGASISFTSQTKNADYSPTSGYDAAQVNMGSDWRMPTANEFQELYDNTDNEWTTINGVAGCKFMKKSDHSVYVFFPATGVGINAGLHGRGQNGSYWSSSLLSADRGYRMFVFSSDVYPQNDYHRFYGYSVRAVREAPKAVDLGLPSGKLWSDRNIGALSAESAGLYFAWGETEGYKDAADRNAKLDRSDGFSSNAYIATGAYTINANLTDSNDAAV